jgi:hypothetical protein
MGSQIYNMFKIGGTVFDIWGVEHIHMTCSWGKSMDHPDINVDVLNQHYSV